MISANDFIPSKYTHSVEKGNFQWSAPSNIALVKYWGKKDNQIPANPSVSFTLNNCKTNTKLAFAKKQNDGAFSFDLLFEGKPKEDFKPKIQKFLERIEVYLPFLKDYHFTIDTQNTFPHSSGIASSASGMAALAMNLMSLEKTLNPEMTEEYFFQKASFLARLGSGSACRSVKGSVVVWGNHANISGSSDLFGVEFPNAIHANFKNFQDTILLVDKGEKQVSSTIGHDLMHNHPFAERRFAQAHENLDQLITIFENGNLEEFIKIVESEALTLHAMMMASMPYFILMKPNTLEIINAIWKFRNESKIPVCFTLDAGANVHVLYPENVAVTVLQFIKDELVGYCQNGQYICDEIGKGAVLS
ncbi:diphosphomevalonate/mevalonate 3,5-bisphosphate decarboxylase family protein [Flavobacterium gawalongense]|uniref:Diphosphomevalonate decarboxylase n=1 Tax=Flavobacterium gawalongense TaxID=2594432 RepID=A0A553BU86_9FLAO|nr:diphosphomevalonate decarboxylase [Flavobacterium gawalongense]TRX02490.1 diphosphomevalonate decarboxylase [Flavobacterium gawalongense]TRX07682.1 diphosphomevalonate decarboxylase [Flavobacterium gawalongense]TRX11811.1 diphosphomevalonate decarboxylase [Flavobacterium gawalongense]TRX12991.1 diphosphomevalonate decarboxylase [Flavobacterium gawalongense]TRX31041.1 diphosphomevalonate decarboxylase [Flavobacterium gawalongense]